MVTLTDSAAAHIQELAASDTRKNPGLRLSIENGGCSGMQYILTIAPALEGDIQITHAGASLYLDPAAQAFVEGSVIDFEDGLTNAGFRIRNPKAKQTCGCGTSFEA